MVGVVVGTVVAGGAVVVGAGGTVTDDGADWLKCAGAPVEWEAGTAWKAEDPAATAVACSKPSAAVVANRASTK